MRSAHHLVLLHSTSKLETHIADKKRSKIGLETIYWFITYTISDMLSWERKRLTIKKWTMSIPFVGTELRYLVILSVPGTNSDITVPGHPVAVALLVAPEGLLVVGHTQEPATQGCQFLLSFYLKNRLD